MLKQKFCLSVFLLAFCVSIFAEIAPTKIIDFKKTDKGDLKLHIFEPAEHNTNQKKPCIVFFFGGGWVGGDPTQFYQQADWFAKRGVLAISAQYRTRKSHRVSPQACVEDGKSAIRWVRTHAAELGIDPETLIVSGGSAGGHVAACTAVVDGFEAQGEDHSVSSKPAAMILFNPVLDTTRKGYGAEKMKKLGTKLSPCHLVKKGIVPTLVFHGTKDRTVPFENAERFTRLMKETGNSCTLIPFEGKDHGFFNGSLKRPKNGDEDFLITMKKSADFLAALGLISYSEQRPEADRQ